MSKLNLNQEIKKIENTLKQLIQSEDSTLQSAADHLYHQEVSAFVRYS